MRVVVIGGTGNISTSIVRLLLAQGHEVTCFNRGQRQTMPEGARVLIGDRYDAPNFEATMQREAFEVAIDMLSFTREQAESAIRAFRDVQHFIHCSTVATYGIAYRWLPVTEDHPCQPISDYGRDKLAADHALLAAYYSRSFPVTIIRPSTTHGPQQGLFRQIAAEYGWIDRVRKGKPIIVCGDGTALHQYLHVDDAALGFVGVIGQAHCIGQVYNLVDRGYSTWADYHRTLMQIVGREVEMVGIPLADLVALDTPGIGICKDIFAHNSYFSAEKLMRDVPSFRPQHTLESAMRDILAALDAAGRIPDSNTQDWEDQLIAARRTAR